MEFKMSTFVSLTYKASGVDRKPGYIHQQSEQEEEETRMEMKLKTAHGMQLMAETWLSQLEECLINCCQYCGCYIYLNKQIGN